jgi:hypothetical protein
MFEGKIRMLKGLDNWFPPTSHQRRRKTRFNAISTWRWLVLPGLSIALNFMDQRFRQIFRNLAGDLDLFLGAEETPVASVIKLFADVVYEFS